MRPGVVKLSVIDDRVRQFEDECPFFGPNDRCNINKTSSSRCVGSDNEWCLLQEYDKFIVERLRRVCP